MARKLTTKQKTLISKWAVLGIFQLSKIELNELEEMHDYETLGQDAQRFLGDERARTRRENKFFN